MSQSPSSPVLVFGRFFLYFFFSVAACSLSASDQEIERLLGAQNQMGPLVIDGPMHQYLVKRISPAIILIPVLCKQACFVPLPTVQQLKIGHVDIIQCFQKIAEEKSLLPLLGVWQLFLSHNFDKNPLFLREFLLTLITIITHASCHLKKPFNDMDIFLPQTVLPAYYPYGAGLSGQSQGQQTSSHTPSLQDIVDLYYTMNSLPILELLATIDTLVIQLHELVTLYELHSSLTWTQWFAQYWWVAPVVLLAIVRIIIKRVTNYPYLHIYR